MRLDSARLPARTIQENIQQTSSHAFSEAQKTHWACTHGFLSLVLTFFCFLARQHRKVAVAAIALLKKNLNKVKSTRLLKLECLGASHLYAFIPVRSNAFEKRTQLPLRAAPFVE